MKKKHAFAVCAYKESPYLEECIRSLKSQTVESDVMIFTSTPCPYIRGIAKKYKASVYVREGESGLREDWTFALRTAGRDHSLVTIAHQDDRYHRKYVKTLLSFWERYPDMTVFCSDYVVLKTREQAICLAGGEEKYYPVGTNLIAGDRVRFIKKLLRLPLRLRCLAGRTWVKRSALVFGNSICCPSCTYNYDIIGGQIFHSDFSFALDWDNLYELAERPGRFICEERPLIAYRVHDGAATKKCIDDRSRTEDEIAMFRKIWPDWAVRLLMHFYKKAYVAYEGGEK